MSDGTKMYGIPNCDTIKKARNWMEKNNVNYVFHDYKKSGITADKLEEWLLNVDLDVLLNKRGTSWRKLSDADKDNQDSQHLVALMLANPTLIKRPVIERDGVVSVGFSKDVQASFCA